MMKVMGFALVLMSASSVMFSTAEAAIPQACDAAAVRAVERMAPEGEYDEEGFFVEGCRLTSKQTAIVCEVSASKGEGEASDTYRVILDRQCERVYRVRLIGEE